MKTKRFAIILLALTLLLPLFVGVRSVSAAYPSFTISEVKTDVSVTILTKDMPANFDFVVRMGEYNTRGVNGIEVATFKSGEGGSFLATFAIPDALKGRAMISIRIDSTTGGYYYYNWFWNDAENGTWPDVTPPPTPVPPQPEPVPTFLIKSVDPSKTVTIVTSNFPKNVDFTVRMGKMWTQGINGIEVARLNSGEGGSFEATFDIPAEIKDYRQVSIRLEGTLGYYAYNWFWNVANGIVEPPVPPTPPVAVVYPSFAITAVKRDQTVSIRAFDLPKDTEFTVLMGKMWTMGIAGVEAATFNSGEGGTMEATFPIPASLAGLDRISIRLQSSTVFAYNWFWNFDAGQ